MHFTGTPEQLAAHVIAWQDAGAVDGFTIMGSTLPYELTAFVDHVVPILQRQGRFRTEYTGSTLRDHLGLDRPAGRTSQQKLVPGQARRMVAGLCMVVATCTKPSSPGGGRIREKIRGGGAAP